MRQLYKDKEGNLLFRKSFCAYIDILGFSEKIIAHDLSFFNSYLNILQKELKHLDEYHDLSNTKNFKTFELKIFTDNFAFGHPWYDEYGEVELGNIFDALSHIQFTFSIQNIYVKGAISLSDLYLDENIVMGPAIIESYKLESEKAIYPRIILSKDVEEVVNKHIGYYSHKSGAPQNRLYLKDVDGYCFINYLYTLLYDDQYSEDEVIIQLEQHKQPIIENLDKLKANYKLFIKYSWLAKYHNYFCDNFVLARFPQIDISILKIDETLYLKNITRLV